MVSIVLFDGEPAWKNLLPLTFTRPVSEVRIGILTIREKWEKIFKTACSYQTRPYLSKKYPLIVRGPAIFINSKIIPTKELAAKIRDLQPGEAISDGSELLAYHSGSGKVLQESSLKVSTYTGDISYLLNVWDIFQKNEAAIRSDFELLTSGRKTEPLSPSLTVIGDPSQIFLEEGAKAEACIINTTTGPVYLGRGAEIMEGSAIRGPLALCEYSTLKLCSKIYGATTIGPHCKVGGEVNNSVIFGYSNKAHDGFLGNSVIGEWCNIGADTNNSNLKNNYSHVKLFNYNTGRMEDTGLQFCGLIMGDHSKTGINTMFNTGTVVGVGSNIYGGGFPATHILSFSWGGPDGFKTHRLDKLFATEAKVYERRGLVFGQQEKDILASVFDDTVG
jgi:UDP-N-acetylglucosamine diphosphorylase/glucosamine-1-phosphate N-acetyltransferase